MARNLDKIQLPTNITDIAMLSVLLRAVKDNEPLTPQDSKTIFEEAKKDGKRKKKSKGDTHTEKALYAYGLIKYVGTDKKSFVVTNLGEELLSIYNEDGALLCDENTFVKVTLKVFSAWLADNKGRNIHPGQIILQLLCDADLGGYITEHEVAQMVYNPTFKLDSQYDEIKAFLLDFRSKQLASPYTKTTKAYIFLPSLVNNWHILEKESIDSLTLLADGRVVIGGDAQLENGVEDEDDDTNLEDIPEEADDEDTAVITEENLYGTITKYRLTDLAKKIICDRAVMFVPNVSTGKESTDTTSRAFTPEWFREKASEYPTLDSVATKVEPSQDICYNTGYSSEYPRNRILFGAPGTGKSFTLNREKDVLLADGGEYERVTFHPDYSYANFVGTYKPVPCKDSDGKDSITYSYVPGPFMRTYVKALQNSRTDTPKPFLLVIEEINRANVAAVFGDVFQLLDRGDDEVSEYPIQTSEDIKKYLAGELGGNPNDYAEIRIPDNMFIWATMNSADQGVFPMDTAFKRRWDFTYLGIDDSEAGIVGKKVVLGQGEYRRVIEWNALRKAINNELLTYKVNEDKLMGPYFIAKKNLPEGEEIDPVVFARIFKNKVIMYLFDDAAKQKRITLFGGCDEKGKNQYSKICREFDTKGVYIFCEGISSQFVDNIPEDDGV